MAEKKQIDEMTELYKSKMLNELDKFLNVYNEVSGTTYVFDLTGQYDHLIRVLGKYISCIYTPEGWRDTCIRFSDEVIIEFEVFRNTPYEEKVAKYLETLRRAFNDSLDTEIEEYLSKTKDFNEEEKVICREFYGKVSDLHRCMKQASFGGSLDTDIRSTESIDQYKATLREFNSYTTHIASNARLNALIRHFDGKIRQLAGQKKQVEVLFDV